MHWCPWVIQMKCLSLHLKNHQNFKGLMINGHSINSNTLRQRIEAMPEDSILFRSDFPEYHAEFVGSTLSELTNEGALTKITQGIYWKTFGPNWLTFKEHGWHRVHQRECHPSARQEWRMETYKLGQRSYGHTAIISELLADGRICWMNYNCSIHTTLSLLRQTLPNRTK